MSEKIIPYKNSEKGKKEQIEGMFNSISGKYDTFNRLMTLRMDVKWRRNVRKQVAKISAKKILDVATGTADLAIELTQITDTQIIGLDLSQGMLDVGKQKVKHLKLNHRIELILGDSEKLPFDDASFDAVTVGFGVRNFEDLNKGLSEIYRVLRPNGRLVILETSVPEHFPIKQGYFIYTRLFIPLLGKLFAKNQTAYAYLSESASKFPYGKKFADILKQIGFSKIKIKPQTLSVATIYVADK